jgi:hypothetical protein
MSTHADVLRAKADAAAVTLASAEKAFSKALAVAGLSRPPWASVTEMAGWRCVESRLEGLTPDLALARAHSAFKRAERALAKARSAAHRARWDAPPASARIDAPAGLSGQEVLTGLQALRGAP